jgi:hypothetical protein
MCDERERLIDYLYDEGEPHERAEVQAHLAECATCRREIGALRSVRQDLLAWAVPDSDPVWRPLAPVRPVPTWRDVPTWTLAAAAAIVVLAGISGAVATRLLLPPSAPMATVSAPASSTATVVSATAPPNGAGNESVTREDLARLEQRLRAAWQMDVNQRIVAATSHQPARTVAATATGADAATLEDLRRRVADFERWRANQTVLNVEFNNQINRVWTYAAGARSTAVSNVIPTSFAR